MTNFDNDLPKSIGEPATNALLAAGISTLEQVAKFSDKDLLALHGVGPKAVHILRDYISTLNDS